MGMDISAKLMYGKYYRELVDHLDEETLAWLEDALDYGDIDSASPHYDSAREGWFVGYMLEEDFDLEGIRSFIDSLKEAEEKFFEKFNQYGTVLAVPDVT